MSLPNLNENLNIHQSLPNQPALTAEELKQEFDKAPNLIKAYINEVLLPEINTVVVNLQNKDTDLETALTTLEGIVNEAVTNITNINSTLSGLKSGATTKISSGTSVPSNLENGEIYLQYFT